MWSARYEFWPHLRIILLENGRGGLRCQIRHPEGTMGMLVDLSLMWMFKFSSRKSREPQIKTWLKPNRHDDGQWIKHDDVIKWKLFPRYWPFVWGIHRSTVNSPHKGQWRGALIFCLICAWYKRLSKQLWGWWFETSSLPLWRQCKG